MARPLVLLVSIVLLVAACTDDDPTLDPASTSSSSTSSTSTSPSTSSGETTSTSRGSGTTATTSDDDPGRAMSGPTGSGRASYRLVSERSEFCYRIEVRGIGEVSGSHLHRRGGEVVLGLQPPAEDGSVDTCAATDALLIQEIDADPSAFYLDAHGARGDLRLTL